MNIIMIPNKIYMAYDFYIKHLMHSVDYKLNALINRDKILIN